MRLERFDLTEGRFLRPSLFSANEPETSSMTTNNIDDTMRNVLLATRTIAVVGASDKTSRAAHGVMKFLQGKGYRCIPVSPRLAGKQLLGETVYATLSDIPVKVDMVDLFINSELAGPATAEAIAINAQAVWMQLGVVNETAAAAARAAGLMVIMDHCPAQEWSRLGLD